MNIIEKQCNPHKVRLMNGSAGHKMIQAPGENAVKCNGSKNRVKDYNVVKYPDLIKSCSFQR